MKPITEIKIGIFGNYWLMYGVPIEPTFCTRIASFDVGLKHMSVCVIDFYDNDFHIRKWFLISMKGKNISEFTNETIEKLRLQHFGCIDYVLIEQQINRNTQMKVISHVIQAYFQCELKIPTPRVIFVSPKKRVDSTSAEYSAIVSQVKEQLGLENTYSRRDYKNISILIANHFLQCEHLSYWKNFFTEQTKKDDYADSLVQAIAWKCSYSINDPD